MVCFDPIFLIYIVLLKWHLHMKSDLMEFLFIWKITAQSYDELSSWLTTKLLFIATKVKKKPVGNEFCYRFFIEVSWLIEGEFLQSISSILVPL